MQILVTGGAGYLGSVLVRRLLDGGHHVRVLDLLLYGRQSIQELETRAGFDLRVADIRDQAAVAEALEGIDAVVHLAAIVGDPACARQPEAARAINLDATLGLIRSARAAGVSRFVFASTCSNYGRMADTSMLAGEDHELRPVSLYASTKVEVERALLQQPESPMTATVLRFATLYGPSPRMRFDLTVNEFVRSMLVEGRLLVYGEQFWRPYVHVADAARAIGQVLEAPPKAVAAKVFNVGNTQENYRKIDLVNIIREQVPGAQVEFVARTEDPRDYRVSFERIRRELHFQTAFTVPDGVREIAGALEQGDWREPEAAHSNVAPQPRAAVMQS
ncbi:MAG: NAD(P)-dependent oxidoreductase [Bryobacterales bacterium]|nr:NAD(P)-dependent oxidoreductase [Bryobacterales bacterium]